MLRSGDLRTQVATDTQLRRWHNRAVHDAFGVALGLGVSLQPQSGAGGVVAVEAGVAYDRFGRALTLLAGQTMPLPVQLSESTPFTLVIRYRETSSFPAPQDRSGVCFECGGAKVMEAADLVWIAAAALTPDDGVPLARMSGTQANPRTDTGFVAQKGRPLSRPYLANGSTIAGGTAWTAQFVSASVVAFDTTVDTTAAGFTRTPCYLAWLEDGAKLAASLAAIGNAVAGNAAPAPTAVSTNTEFPLYFAHVEAAESNRFKFSVLVLLQELARSIVARGLDGKAFPVRLDAYVCWLGCQSTRNASHCLDPHVRKPCCC
ncbi:hypothetical protein F3J12_33030 [Burkholderia sp. Ax-1735]|nr:hypothetical protein [Burkholderia sp. Ax-1735]NIF14240.1 hypothetical protein [Burkholderia sp. Ax-1735]